MSEHTQQQPADRTFGAAEDPEADDDELSESPAVHGAEGGGDPAAGAEEDSAEPDPRRDDY